jgi:hypothetical protein
MTLAPGFWLQHSFRGAHDLVDIAADIEADLGFRPGIVLTPVNATSTLRALYEEARNGGNAFLDPSGWTIDRDSKKLHKKSYVWLDAEAARPTDTAGWKDWMEQSLDHQTSTALLGSAPPPVICVTPSPYL